MEQLKQLYELLQKNYTPLSEDLSYDEFPDPNIEINTEFPDLYKHLKSQSSICCDQKIIYWDANTGFFILSCLYNAHPTLKYATAEEIVAFFRGYTQSNRNYFDYDDTKDSEQKAYEDGKYTYCYENVKRFKNYYDLNITDSINYK